MSLVVLISEAFEVYRLEHIVYLNQSKRTEEMSLGARNALIKYTGDIPIEDLTFDLVRKYKEHLEKTMGQNTVRGYIIKLRVVLKHLAIKGYKNILNHEMVGVPKRADRVVDFLRPDEIDHFIDIAFKPAEGYRTLNRHKNRAMISLLYSSGIRVTELCNLNIADLRDDLSFTIIGKGGKARLCFFDNRSKKFIDTYLALRNDRDPALFISSQTSKRINKGGVELIFRNISVKAGFKKSVHPHMMRHSFATNLLKNNANLIYVKTFLGHSSVQTTEMYTHVVNEDLRAIYREKHTI